MDIKKIINFLKGYRELTVIGVTSKYVILANRKGRILGITNLTDDNANLSVLYAKKGKNTEYFAIATPASLKHDIAVKLIVHDKENVGYWGEDEKKELVFLETTTSYHDVLVAATIENYYEIAIYNML